MDTSLHLFHQPTHNQMHQLGMLYPDNTQSPVLDYLLSRLYQLLILILHQ